MSIAALANYENQLKTLYEKKWVDLVYTDHTLLSLVPQKPGARGNEDHETIIIGPGGGFSATFADAQANSSAHSSAAWKYDVVDEYGVGQLARKAIRKGRDVGAILNVFKSAADLAFKGCGMRMNSALFRNGNGVAGQEGGTWTSPSDSVTLTDKADAWNFWPGLVIRSSATATGAYRTGELTVEAVNYDTGTITFTAACDTGISAFAQDDYLFVDGDGQNGGGTNLRMEGFESFVPAAAPTTTLFNVDRSVSSLLGGNRLSDSGITTYVETMNTAASKILFGRPNYCVMHNDKYAGFITELHDAVRYQDVNPMKARVGFTGIVISTGKGDVVCLPDPMCPVDLAIMGDFSQCKIRSVDKTPDWLTDEQGQSIIMPSADARELRVGGYLQFLVSNPAAFCRIDMQYV